MLNYLNSFIFLPIAPLGFIFLFFNFKTFFLTPQIKNFVLKNIFWIIHIFSKTQIFFNKTMLLLDPYFQYLQNLFNLKTKSTENSEYIDFIYQGKEIFHCIKNEIKNKKTLFPDKFDFIIFTKKDENYIFHKKIIYSKNFELNDFIIEKTDYYFFLIELKIFSTLLKLDLQCKKNKINFYIVDNKINASFLYYFIKKYEYNNLPKCFSFNFKQFVENFSLKIIDNSINIQELFYLDDIVLKKTHFEISQIFRETFQQKISDSFVIN